MKRIILTTALAITLTACVNPMETPRWKYIEANPHLSDEIKGAIFHQQIMPGMTKEQVRAAIGEPCGYCYGTRTSSTGDTWEYNTFGTSIYGAGRGQYVFFNNKGKVIGWNK